MMSANDIHEAAGVLFDTWLDLSVRYFDLYLETGDNDYWTASEEAEKKKHFYLEVMMFVTDLSSKRLNEMFKEWDKVE